MKIFVGKWLLTNHYRTAYNAARDFRHSADQENRKGHRHIDDTAGSKIGNNEKIEQ